MKKRYIYFIFVIISFFVLFSPVSARSSFQLYRNGQKHINNLSSSDVGYSYGWYEVYSYAVTNSKGGAESAFCVDPHLTFGGAGTYVSDMGDSSIYAYYLNHSSDTFPKQLIQFGQYMVDPYDGRKYEYEDIQLAIRKLVYSNSSWRRARNAPWTYDTGLYDMFASSAMLSSGSWGAVDLYKNYNNAGYSSGAGDGFDYDNGFWEARVRGENDESGFSTVDGKTIFAKRYITNIRPSGTNDSLICSKIDSSKFNCEVGMTQDLLNTSKYVVMFYITSKEGVNVTESDLNFEIPYNDPREANNFYLLKSSDRPLAQRMFTKDNVDGTIYIGVTPTKKYCKIEDGNYYDDAGNILNGDAETKAKDFIEACGCTKASAYSQITSTNEYIAVCTNVPHKTFCQPYTEKDTCGRSIKISDNMDCIFGTNGYESTINSSVSDSRGTNNHTYTTEKNEYCNISCAEQIEFEMPGEVDGVVGGTYFTFDKYASGDKTAVNATGTRTCRATLAMNSFNNRVSATSSDDDNAITESILNASNTYVDNSTYSFYQQNKSAKAVYDSIYSSYDYTSSNSCSYSCGTDEHPRTCYDTTYSISMTYAGKTFTASHTSCPGASSTFTSSEMKSGSLSLATFKTKLASVIDDTADMIEGEIDKLDSCTTSFDTDKIQTYDFNPNIIFSYDEPYTNFFAGKVYNKSTVELDASSSSATFDSKELTYSYNNGGTIGSKTRRFSMIDNYSDGAHIDAIAIKKIRQYNSPLTFYALVPSGTAVINDHGVTYKDAQGVEYSSPSLNKMNANVYPLALNKEPGKYNYSFLTSNLGDNSISSAGSTGRMDALLSNERRTYYCNYSRVQDICVHGTDPDCKNEFFYRNVSLNNFNPNDRSLGPNWNTTKGRTTQCEIDSSVEFKDGTDCSNYLSTTHTTNEQIYDKTPDYKFTLTPDDMQSIRDYNRTKGSYANDSLTKKTTNIAGMDSSLESVWYTSKFLDEIRNYTSDADISQGRSNFAAWTGGDVKKLSGTGPAWK